MSRRIVLASSNAGKLREFRALLEPGDFEVVSQGELGIESAEEPHLTFIENALAKARHAAARSGLPALADDSGLCVQALGGAPGVHSARFAGPDASDAANNAELLRRMQHRSDRLGHYVCVLVAVRSADDPEPLLADGRWHRSTPCEQDLGSLFDAKNQLQGVLRPPSASSCSLRFSAVSRPNPILIQDQFRG